MNIEKYKYNFIKRIILNILDKIKKILLNDIPSIFIRFKNKVEYVINVIYSTYKEGNIFTRLSYLIIGIGHIKYKKTFKGLFYILYEFIFVFYMFFFGWKYLKLFKILGVVETTDNVYNENTGVYERIWGDNSMLILLYSVVTIFFIMSFHLFIFF